MRNCLYLTLCTAAAVSLTAAASDSLTAPPPLRFSTNFLDRSTSPAVDFYQFASGQWLKDNPIPRDKSYWGEFAVLAERNWYNIHQILEDISHTPAPARSTRRLVGDFYLSAMDTNRIEKLGLKPIEADLKRIDRVKDARSLFTLLGELHDNGCGALFETGFEPDDKNSAVYAVELEQGGLSLPDRDYYLKDSFAEVRTQFRKHLETMFQLLGEKPADAIRDAATVITLETELARVSRTRVDLRDPEKNYNKVLNDELLKRYPALPWGRYFAARKMAEPKYEIVGQPEFFDALNKLVQERPISDWKTYLRWQLLHSSAPYLPSAFQAENFAFYGKVLSGQPEQEPLWKRSARVLDATVGEALGRLFVEKCFPPEARARMLEMVENLKAVYRDRLKAAPWMSEATRTKAIAKFDRFTQKIGYPNKFRDYSSVEIRPGDYLGNVRRAARFESHRQSARVGQAVDRTEWHMTPIAVNAYFDASMNEIVFPAGILQPPFFDLTMDDAVNYGGIGTIIGHEITHGYDDQGRLYDANGNLNDWWSEADAKAFVDRSQKLVDEFNGFEPIPGLHVNGSLTLGENLADLGGVSIAYEALQRALAKDPSKRKKIDGLTPEQRFFLSFAQIWCSSQRDEDLRQLVTVDPHAPDKCRVNGTLMNQPEFIETFGVKPGDPMWLSPEKRTKIW
jgi:putative endopeptidase